MQFSESQLRAIRHLEGPALVLAGPGSGKTTVLTERIKYMIQEGNIPSEEILVITFTKAAASEMEQRFLKKCSSKARFGTFHSIFFSILREHYHYSIENIISDRQKIRILKEICFDLKISESEDSSFYEHILSEISRFKSIFSEHYKKFECSIMENEEFFRLYKEYQGTLRLRRLLDFDDMLFQCKELLEKKPEVLEELRDRYRYILVDEFQDVSPVQYEVLKLLALPRANLFIVGDDDQSIYSFRGADPSIMMGFPNDFSGAVRIDLSDNYRCREEIVCFASRMIANNKIRFKKNIRAAKGHGGTVKIFETPDVKEEYALLTAQIERNLRDGAAAEEIGVLYRTNSQGKPLALHLTERNIPFLMKEEGKNPFRHFIGEDLLSYLRLSIGKGSGEDLIRILNRPFRGLSRKGLRGKEGDLLELLTYYHDSDAKKRQLLRLMEHLNVLRELPTASALIYIEKAIGYEEFLKDYARERNIEIHGLYDILEEIEGMALSSPYIPDFIDFAEHYEEVLKKQRGDKRENSGIHLMTFHGSKGLEFRHVYILDAVEGVTPYRKAKGESAIEEERRSFYVALTRGKETVHIFVTKCRYNKECRMSRFVMEGIPKQENRITRGLKRLWKS